MNNDAFLEPLDRIPSGFEITYDAYREASEAYHAHAGNLDEIASEPTIEMGGHTWIILGNLGGLVCATQTGDAEASDEALYAHVSESELTSDIVRFPTINEGSESLSAREIEVRQAAYAVFILCSPN